LDFKAAALLRSIGHSFLSMVTARAVSIKAWFGRKWSRFLFPSPQLLSANNSYPSFAAGDQNNRLTSPFSAGSETKKIRWLPDRIQVETSHLTTLDPASFMVPGWNEPI